MLPERPHIADRCICCDGKALVRSPAVLMPFVANRVFGWEPVEITPEWGLRDLKPGMAYPLCNSVQCADCGALFLDIRFDDQELFNLYKDYRGEDYTKTRDRFEPGYLGRNRLLAEGISYTRVIEEFITETVGAPDAVLDWGGDTGMNTPFKGKCRIHHVYDISGKPLVDGARRVDIETIAATSYDLITLNSVIEHVSYPRDLLQQIRGVLRSNATLYMEIPYEEVVRQHERQEYFGDQKKHWHEHVNFFTERSLRQLLSASGFEILALRIMPVSAGGKNAYAFSLVAKGL